MKRVSIDAYKKGLVFKNGVYKRMLNEGSHWISLFEDVRMFDMTKPFYFPVNADILLKDKELADALYVLEVKDNEIAIRYENKLFAEVLPAGRYAFWKNVVNYSFEVIDLNQSEINKEISKALLARKEVLSYVRAYTVESYEKGLLFYDGKFEKVLEPGIYFYWKNNTPVVVLKTDMRKMQLEISGQELLTRDKAALRLSFYVQYQINHIQKALMENKDYEKQLYVLMQLGLREFTGTLSLDELLEKKESISAYVLDSLKEKANALGVELLGCGIRDVILPGEMKEIMNQVLIAEKKAQANTIMRREETASTRSLLNTAKLMEENEMLFRLKEMEYVEKIAEKISTLSLNGNNTVIDQLKQIFVPEKNKINK